MRGKATVAILLAASLAACGGGRQTLGGASGLTVVGTDALPAPDRTDLQQSAPYYVGAFDKLSIDVFGIEELSGKEIQVDAGGRITFPLVGEIDVSGHTPNEVGQQIAARLRGHYIRNPQVTVNLKETVSQVLTVEGEVEAPGLYPVVGRMTLLRAIATAKGTTEFSRLNDVVVFRNVGDKRYAAMYDLRAIRNGNYADPQVFAGDVIAVAESRNRRLFKDLLQAAPLLTTPLILLLQSNGNN